MTIEEIKKSAEEKNSELMKLIDEAYKAGLEQGKAGKSAPITLNDKEIRRFDFCLPSGTIWGNFVDERGCLCSYSQAKKSGICLPTFEQIRELLKCQIYYSDYSFRFHVVGLDGVDQACADGYFGRVALFPADQEMDEDFKVTVFVLDSQQRCFVEKKVFVGEGGFNPFFVV